MSEIVRRITVSIPETSGLVIRPASTPVTIGQYDALSQCREQALSAAASATQANQDSYSAATSAAAAAASAAAAAMNEVGVEPHQIPTNAHLGSGAFLDVVQHEASVSWNAPSIANAARASTTVSVSGAKAGDFVMVAASGDLSGLLLSGGVTSDGVVAIVLANLTGAPVDLGTLTYYVRVVAR